MLYNGDFIGFDAVAWAVRRFFGRRHNYWNRVSELFLLYCCFKYYMLLILCIVQNPIKMIVLNCNVILSQMYSSVFLKYAKQSIFVLESIQFVE